MKGRRTTVYLTKRTADLIMLHGINVSELLRRAVDARVNFPELDKIEDVKKELLKCDSQAEQISIKKELLKNELKDRINDAKKKSNSVQWVKLQGEQGYY
jgi:hypothetical protein